MSAVKQPLIIDEYVPAPNSGDKPWRKESLGDAPESKAFVANGRQMAASMAAQVAINQGKTSEEVFKAARQAYDSAVEQSPVQAQEMDPESALKIRWLKAVCRLGAGKFDDCSPRDLVDVAMLVDRPVLPFDAWKEAAGMMEK